MTGYRKYNARTRDFKLGHLCGSVGLASAFGLGHGLEPCISLLGGEPACPSPYVPSPLLMHSLLNK